MIRRGTIAALAVTVAAAAALALATGPAGAAGSGSASLSGAGSSFVFPLVSTWAARYAPASVSYNPIGSGGGIAAITNRNVDFGASDAPLSRDQFAACKGCVQIPWALSATAVAYNLPGVKNNLHMSGRVLADIYLGKIERWNDPRIQRLNRGVSLPSTKIAPVYRSDNSGTTYNFTEYLSGVSAQWRSKIGKGVSANWPTGQGGKGSSGVAGIVSRTEGAITYVDVAYAKKNRLQFLAMQNRSGKFALPGLRGIQAAAASDTRVGANNEMAITNPPKRFKNAYPICTYSYAILPLKTGKARDLKRFVTWALTAGQPLGRPLLFQPVPQHVRAAGLRTLRRVHA